MPLLHGSLFVARVVVVMLVVPGALVLYLPWLLAHATPGRLVLPMGAARSLALLPWGLGAGIALWSALAFRLTGRGLPTSVAPPKELVAHGPYRHVRNPMYLGALLIVAGHAVWTGSLLLMPYGIALFATFHAFVVGYEEPRLRARFGDSYEAFARSVPRWLPRLRPRRSLAELRRP